jgi:hypothetical protein
MKQWQFEEARSFIASVPWRAVQMRAYTDTPVEAPPDPHEYTVLQWQEVDRDGFWKFVRLIREFGYKGRYAPPYAPDQTMINSYLEIDGHIYWATSQLINRQKAEHRQHEIIAPAPGGGRGGSQILNGQAEET